MHDLGNAFQGIQHDAARVRLDRGFVRGSDILGEPIKETCADQLQGIGLLANSGERDLDPIGVLFLFVVKVDGETSGQNSDDKGNDAGNDTCNFHSGFP